MSEHEEKNPALHSACNTGLEFVEPQTESVDQAAVLPNGATTPPRYAAVAPHWHTFVLVVALLLFSWFGAQSSLKEKLHPERTKDAVASASHTTGKTASSNDAEKTTMSHKERMLSYGTTLALEFLFLGWVWFGMHLRGIPLSALLANQRYGWLRTLGIAAAFWIIAMTVLGSCAVGWMVAEKEFRVLRHPEHNSSVSARKNIFSGKLEGKSASQDERAAREKPASALLRLAPSNALECFLWLLLSVSAGVCEEIIFRGYLQRQFSSICGKAAVGAAFSSLCFGLCHGYEGVRSMFLITIFGALFSVLALRMRSLKPGMLAHAWHDLLTGYAIAALKSAGFF